MARKTETTEIDGLKFTVTQLPGRKAAEMSVRLLTMLAPAVAKAGAGLGSVDWSRGASASVDMGRVFADMGLAAETLFARLTPDEIQRVSKELYAFAKVEENGQELPMTDAVIDEVFAGRAGALFRFLIFALKVNFADFGPALAEEFRAAMAKVNLSRNTSKPPGLAGAA